MKLNLENKAVKEGGFKILKGCFDMVISKIKDNNGEKAIRVYDEICYRTKNKHYRKELALKSAKILEIVEIYERSIENKEGNFEEVIVNLAERIDLDWRDEK